ncbi:hypothetical protein OBBRIDRAFT_423529 [Obba rivulosa]|uniref:Uncharacterized protein n=1 Tax=Obba rivulosa TaxID=1052685 RepID=A0A8E2B2H0_9APHY|nr:hypothetical protein OBBRIDRAFT_423529 [Obba rivulosa]
MAAGARVCSEFYSDIIDEIRTNYDDDDDDERIHTLASCCLVSKAWLGEIRSTRWRSLDLNDGNIDSFCGLLDTVPDIGSYVARLDIDLGYDNYGDLAGDNNDPGPSSDDEVFADTVEELLPKLPNLVHLSIDIPIVRRSFFTGSAKLRHLGLWNCHIQDGVDGLRACLRILPQLQSLQLKKIYFPEGLLALNVLVSLCHTSIAYLCSIHGVRPHSTSPLDRATIGESHTSEVPVHADSISKFTSHAIPSVRREMKRCLSPVSTLTSDCIM